MEARGVHVNVSDAKTSMHVEIAGVKVDDGYRLEFKPADPTAKKLSEGSKWKKITGAIEDFLTKPSNSSKLANVAEAAAENFPNNSRDFKTTSEAIKSCT